MLEACVPDTTSETLYVKYHTMTWYEEKTDPKDIWRFLRTNKNSPLKK